MARPCTLTNDENEKDCDDAGSGVELSLVFLYRAGKLKFRFVGRRRFDAFSWWDRVSQFSN